MSVYSFRSGPTYRAATPAEQFDAAFDQPLSLGATLGQQFKGGILESLGLGTALRSLSLPERITDRPARGESLEQRQARVDAYNVAAMPEDAYKASPYYREGVKWDRGMTEDRAAALAEAYDAKRVRDHFASKRPFTAFLGNLAGQAVDPINYIPIAGPTVKAASIARLGRVGGHIATGALDAAANTAVASAATYDTRQSMGDEITWQSTVTDIAMSALIGSAFGTIGGVIDARRSVRLADAKRAAEAQLATLKNVQDARIALNGAIDGLARGEDVNLSANAASSLQGIVDRSNPVWSPDLFASMDRRDLFSTTSVGRFVDNRPVLVQDAETLLRNQALATDTALAQRFTAAEAKFRQAEEAVAALEEPLAARTMADALALVDEASAPRMAAIEKELAGNIPAARRAQLEAERDLIIESVGPDIIAKAESDYRIGPQKQAKGARKALATARQEYSKARREVDTIAERIRAENRIRFQARADMSPAKPEPLPTGKVEAEARIAKPETFKETAEQYRVNADDGSFIEQTDIDQMRKEGRLTSDDEAVLTESDQTYENGVAYGEVLKAVAGCFI